MARAVDADEIIAEAVGEGRKHFNMHTLSTHAISGRHQMSITRLALLSEAANALVLSVL